MKDSEAAARSWPVLRSLRGYRKAWLGPDAVAGIVLATVLLPQGMAYAEVAGLPPVVGLYATIFPLLAFALFGASRNLVVGPDSSTAAMVAGILVPLAAVGSARYTSLAATLALIVGVLYLLARLARLGFLSEFVAGPVISGYQAGLAIVIWVGQLPKMLGISVDAQGTLAEAVAIVRSLGQASLTTVAVSAASLAVILILRRVAPKVPAALVAVAGATLASWVFDLPAHDVKVVGTIPSGLPHFGLPAIQRGDITSLLVGAAGIWLVSFADTVATTRLVAARSGDEVDVDGDMTGVGAAEIAAGVASGFPLSASASRSVVVQTAGARSQLANVVAALLVTGALFVTGPIAYIPIATLGAIVFAAAIDLFDLGSLRRLWRWRRTEFAVAVTTLVGVVVFGILPGIVVAIVFSIVNFVRRLAWPSDAVLGRATGRTGYQKAPG